MKKKVIKPFSVDAWLNGAKIETRDGYPVRVICTDFNSVVDEKSIVAAVTTTQNGNEALRRFYQNGHYFPSDEDGADIVIVEEIEERWADDKEAIVEGWYIGCYCHIKHGIYTVNDEKHYDVFATEKQAKSALAMARISQLMAHDERYGGVVTDKEWQNSKSDKFVLCSYSGHICRSVAQLTHHLLAFHTEEQRELFLQENYQLVKDYLMIDRDEKNNVQ